MANENFTDQDHKWTVRYGSPRDYQNWNDFYGDEYNWSSMVPILWQSIDSPAARIMPPKAKAQGFNQETCAWWTGALHLLAFGMGWTNMAQGLRRWREGGYRVENAVLRLLYNTYGPSIEALEYWLHGQDFQHLLSNKDDYRDEPMPMLQQSEDQLRKLEALISSGPRHQLTREILNSNDSLHLQHFIGSIGASTFSPNQIDEDLRDDNHGRRQVRVRLYVGWHRTVSNFMRDTERQRQVDESQVGVLVGQIGYLGTYSLSPATGKAFRLTPRSDFSRDHEFHMMGN